MSSDGDALGHAQKEEFGQLMNFSIKKGTSGHSATVRQGVDKCLKRHSGTRGYIGLQHANFPLILSHIIVCVLYFLKKT